MTTYYTRTTICGVCSTSFEYSDISSTNSFGSPDLDTRPPEMQRSTINTWVQRCPGCGACAFDLSRLDNSAKSIIESPKYKEQLNNKEYSDLANYFLCKSIIEENLGQHVNATWSLIHGAWILDDNSSL